MHRNNRDRASQDPRPEIVARLQSIVGSDVLFLSWPLGMKGTKRKWKHLTIERMGNPAYLAKFTDGNIGIAQGTVSGGLCSIDIDLEDDDGFLALNPRLAQSLRSKGERGCNVWFRATGKSPPTKKIKSKAGLQWGELRANGSQTIIHGKHPSGCDYRLLVESPPVEIAIEDIVWPEHVINPLSNSEAVFFEKGQCTEGTEGTEGTQEMAFFAGASFISTVSSVPSERSSVQSCGLIQSIDDAIAVSLPSKAHANHFHLLTLARAIKTLEHQQGTLFTPDERRAIFNRWHDEARPLLRGEQTREQYLVEFLNCYRSAKYLIGEVAAQAWDRALKRPLRSDFQPHFTNAQMRLLLTFCFELQCAAGDQPFFLAARTAAKLLGQPTHSTAALWLGAFVADEILGEIEKGSVKTGRASRYRFNECP